MSGEVGHFEIPADNVDRARKFYTAAFGWKMTEVPHMDYTMVATGPVDDRGMPSQPGYIGGGIGKRGENLPAPVFVIVVDDITASETAIEKHGGKIMQKKQAIGDGTMGYLGYFRDSEGNVVSLYEAGKK